MKRALPWILNLLLVVVVCSVLVWAFNRDNDSENTVKKEPITTTTTTEKPSPDATGYIAEGPFYEQLVSSLRREGGVDMNLSEWDSDDWDLAQVRSISGNNMTIRSGSQVLLLFTDDSTCGVNLPNDYFGDLFDPGDWALWDTGGDEGNDTLICEGEIVLVKEG